MHTPTTTTREKSGAPAMISSITPGTPTHSKITGLFGSSRRAPRPRARRATTAPAARCSFSIVPTPSSSAARRAVEVSAVRRSRRRASPPRGRRRRRRRSARASARRPGEKSLATTLRTPLRLEHADHRQADRPAADHDRHAGPSSPRRAGRRASATAIGSVSAAMLGRQPVGDRQRQRLLDQHLLGVGARRRRRQADRVHRRAAPQQRQRDDGRPGRDALAACPGRARRPRRRTRAPARPAGRSASARRSRSRRSRRRARRSGGGRAGPSRRCRSAARRAAPGPLPGTGSGRSTTVSSRPCS